MTSKLMKFAIAGVLGLGLSSGLAFASAADDAIAARQACMKANGGAMKVFVPMYKGDGGAKFDAAAVADALAKVETACSGWAGWWGEDTKTGGAEPTKAKAEIWSDKAGFEAAGGAYVDATTALKAATDDASFKAAFEKLGGACKGCHEKFRAAE